MPGSDFDLLTRIHEEIRDEQGNRLSDEKAQALANDLRTLAEIVVDAYMSSPEAREEYRRHRESSDRQVPERGQGGGED